VAGEPWMKHWTYAALAVLVLPVEGADVVVVAGAEVAAPTMTLEVEVTILVITLDVSI